MNLYRKYRSQNFSELVGQHHIADVLKQAIILKQVTHAYLFSGPRGTGKTSTARILAKAVNCEKHNENGEPCNSCDICIQITEDRLPDVIEIDAASNRGIDEIRSLKEKINFLPSVANKKVYIIDEVHMLTKEAFNALLKTLEEPPAHVVFILATTEVHKVPETITSRCQHFRFKRIADVEICQHLEEIAESENIKLDQEILELLSKQVRGGMRDAISLLDQIRNIETNDSSKIKEEMGIIDLHILDELWNALQHKEVNAAFDIVDQLHESGYQLEQCCIQFLHYLRNKMKDHTEDPSVLANVIHYIETFEEARTKMKYASIPQLPLEVAIMKVCIEGAEVIQNIPVPAKNKTDSDKVIKEVKKEEKKVIEVKTEESKKEIEIDKQENHEVTTNEKKLTASSDINLQTLQEKWHDVLSSIKTPFIRIALKQANLLSYENATLTIGFNSEFSLEKIRSSKTSSLEIRDSVLDTVGESIEVEFTFFDGNIPTVEQKKVEDTKTSTKKLEYEEIQSAVNTIFQS